MVFPFTPPPAVTTRPTLQGNFGMVSSTHWLASASAQAVLERGGNAFDAAAAGAFVLHVVEPHLNGPGGDMSALISVAGAEPKVLMGQGPAPAGATIEHFRGEGLDLVPGTGGLAAAVPGAVEAWFTLLAEHGSWPLPDILEYAIGYARGGHPVAPRVTATIGAVRELFEQHWPSSAAQWMPGGRVPEAGELVTNPAYARTLERLAAEAAGAGSRREGIEAAGRAWREGFVAREAAAFLKTPHRHSTGGDHAAVIGASDFAAFRAGFEPAVSATFRGVRVAKTGPWGQGPVLLQTLAILDGFDDAHLDPSTELGAHTILEALKLAMADRDAYYGDPQDSTRVPLQQLLSSGYAAERRALIGESASAEFRPGRIDGVEPYLPKLLTEDEWRAGTAAAPDGAVGEPTVRASGETRGDTCHLAVTDRHGNMVAATPSGGWLQSSPTVPELGFCLGTRLQMTWLESEAPSALRPGGRPRTTLTPTMLSRGGRTDTALGSPGGDQQDQWQLLYLLRTIVGGYSPQEAIDAPAFHTTSLAGSFWPRTWEPAGAVVEDRLGEEVIAGLEQRGHRVTRAGDWSLGRLCVAGRNPASGVLYAAANPRGMQGYAAGR
ncbi:gamma-glutamyltransferase [Paenarthrobacter sp. DKR-5]|uniref:gamma-glutamyltransferase family protein n=1 Tax=Paenarthrobacter sp. DKR-5 TaxID=2835535 RepID=UPI001BDC5924|nr:gamma-glutamyltransferase [Paenarthrobacter sp. DKR-5]MBT1003819.1 gamma-glutamyltransferase [Paenarthrobacter sp. DKR-5]